MKGVAAGSNRQAASGGNAATDEAAITEELRILEQQSRALEPSANERLTARGVVVGYAEEFLDRIGDLKAFEEREASASTRGELEITEEAIGIGKAMEVVGEAVDGPGLNPASGGHLGYIPGGGIYYSSLGDYAAAITNRYAGIYFASPGAVRMEHALVRWMAELAGYPASAAGTLTSGGSLANLAAIVAARDASGLAARDWHRAVIYSTEHAHHCLDKAYRIAGLGEAIMRRVPMDDCFRMETTALDEMIRADERTGLRPLLVVASAGTTDTGAIDPLENIAVIARSHKLWFHVDAAYGGFFLLTEEGRMKLAGIEQSDSVVMDPHKGLFLPYGLGAVMVREGRSLRQSHSYTAAYMQDAQAREAEDSPANLSAELTRHFRGLRLWLPLKLHGLAPFRACLREKLLLAKYVWQQLRQMPGFEVLNEPELSVVAFRYVPRHGDADGFNRRLQAAVQRDGRVFISSSRVRGQYILRMAILSFRTHLETVQLALRILHEAARALEREDGAGRAT
jgi:glutamate/tyrosine decarboxylase-like PLP-dependent enzyme